MDYLIGIDIGTSGTKAALFDIDGNVIKSSTAEYGMSQPYNGWAEQDPQDWWNAVQKTLADIWTDGVAGIGLSGQMHGLVMLDEKNEVIRPAIIWCDQRTAAECDEITDIIGRKRLINITANPALTGFTASKIMWVKKHEPEIYAKCRHILLPKDYIRFKLTGEFATDVSDAGGMQLLDIKNRCWSDEVAEKLGIDTDMLPKVYESTEITGYCKGVPVAAGGGDNACAAVGCGIVRSGKAFTTIGTSGVVYAHTDKPMTDPDGRIHTFCAAVPGKWHVMGVTQAAGLSLKWFRENFAAELSYREIDERVNKIPIGSERLLYLPYLMGERTPHLDPFARGVFFGISAMHRKEHFMRAVMEGVAFSLRDCFEVLKENNIVINEMAVVGGGSRSAVWGEMLSGVYNMPVRPLNSEGAAFGAAILAGVAAGVYKSVETACDKLIHYPNEIKSVNSTEYEKYYSIYKELYPALKNEYKKLVEDR
mgnify:FL=1